MESAMKNTINPSSSHNSDQSSDKSLATSVLGSDIEIEQENSTSITSSPLKIIPDTNENLPPLDLQKHERETPQENNKNDKKENLLQPHKKIWFFSTSTKKNIDNISQVKKEKSCCDRCIIF